MPSNWIKSMSNRFTSAGKSMSNGYASSKKYISNSTRSMQDKSKVSYALAQADIFDRTKGYNIKKSKLENVSYNNLTEFKGNKLTKSQNRLSENNLNKLKNFTSNSNKKNTTSSIQFNNEFKASTLKGRMLNTFEKTKLTTGLAIIKNNYTKSLEFINKITNLIKESYNNKKLFQSSCVDLETKKKQLEQSASLGDIVVERYKMEINAIFTKLYDTSKAVIKSNKDIKDNINRLIQLRTDNMLNIDVFLVLLDNNIIDYTRMYTRFFEGESKKNKGEPFDFTVKPLNHVLNAYGNNSTSGNNSTTEIISEYTGVNHNTGTNTKPIAGNAARTNPPGNSTETNPTENLDETNPTENPETNPTENLETNPLLDPHSGGNKKTKTKSSVKKTKAKKDKKTKKVKKTKSTVKKTK